MADNLLSSRRLRPCVGRQGSARQALHCGCAGDANRVGKPGPKRSESVTRSLFGEWSPSTRARFDDAMRMPLSAGCSQEQVEQAIKAASRPNGSMNVSKLLDMAAMRYVMEAER